MTTTRIVRFEDYRIEIFPIGRLVRQNALRERRSMRICDAHASSADANRDAIPRSLLLTPRELRERKRARAVQLIGLNL